MRVVFIGSSQFGLRCLDRVSRLSNIDVSGIVTNKSQFIISYAPEGVKNVLYADFVDYGKTKGISYYVMQDRMTEPDLIAHVHRWKPELFIVAGWYHMLPHSLLDMAPAIGLHASLLPDYSGGAPLVWAMINGEKKTGITLFRFAEGVDNGPVIGQASTDILFEDTIRTLYDRIEVLGLNLLEEHLPLIAGGTAVLRQQDESKRRIFSHRKPEDGRIDWDQPARKIYDFIRAQTRPYPGAFTAFNTKKIHVWESRLIASERRPDKGPGFVYISQDNEILVTCGGKTVLRLISLAIDGKDISAEDWYKNLMNKTEGVFV